MQTKQQYHENGRLSKVPLNSRDNIEFDALIQMTLQMTQVRWPALEEKCDALLLNCPT